MLAHLFWQVGPLHEQFYLAGMSQKTAEPMPLDVVDRVSEELGDVLFVAANIGRKLRIDPEFALRSANRKFETRFHFIENELAKQNREPKNATLQEMVALWEKSKLKS